MTPTETFLSARDVLLRHREDIDRACAELAWPDLPVFNWALDWFDVLARGNSRPALRIFREGAPELVVSYAELSERSSRTASYLRGAGVRRGNRILTMLPAGLPLYDVLLAAIKLGAVIVPTAPQLTAADVEERAARAAVSHLIADEAGAEKLGGAAASVTRIVAGAARPGWLPFDDALAATAAFAPDGVTRREDVLLLYFTSGTTSKPKLVAHTHQSYPVGNLAMMYWLGLREGAVHQNISSPGWSKHAGSSFFAPFNAGATVVLHEAARFSPEAALALLDRARVTSLCAPPTVFRMLLASGLGPAPSALRDLASAGEPLAPEVLDAVRRAWGLTIRDGFGQTETSAVIGNTPGMEVRPGSMGRALPGFDVTLIDAEGHESDEGEIVLRLDPRPTGLMAGYVGDPQRTAEVMAGGYYRTGDQATRDADGYLHHIGRADDLFKSSDYRISPFELESALLSHPAVADVAVVPAPDALRLAVPKAFIVLAPGREAGAEVAREILQHCRDTLAPYRRVRRVELVSELPKTISGKTRRAVLRDLEKERAARDERDPNEYRAEDFNKRERGGG